MKERTKEQKGITLITLIIITGVLLILASVAINSTTNDGILDKAQETKNSFELTQEKEKIKKEILEWQLINSNGTPTLETYLSRIYGEENVQLNVDKSITVTVPSGNKYLVAKDGNVTLLDETVEEPEVAIVSLSLDKTTITKEIESGSTATETLTATLTNATGTLTWKSSNTNVATVSGSENTATVTLKAAGTATITVSYGSYSATCKVTVTEKKAESGTGTVSITSAEVSPTSFKSASNVTINLTANIEKSVANEALTFTYKFYRSGYNTALEEISSEEFSTTTSNSTISLTKTISSSSITSTYNDFLVTLDISDSSGNIKASKSFEYFRTMYGENATFQVYIPCLPAGTMVTVEVEEEDEDGKKIKKRKKKKIEDLTYDDNLVVWDFDNGCFTTVKPLWLMRKQVADEYNLLKFSDGSELKTIRQHRIFNKELGKFTYPMTEETPIGTTTFTEEGKEVKLVSKEIIKEPVEYYNIISDYHMNVFAEGILTSCRLSNLYEIKDMKYVKDGRELISREEYKDIPDEYFYGLRLAEQPREINRGNDDKNSRTLKEYVLNCIRTQKHKNEVK